MLEDIHCDVWPHAVDKRIVVKPSDPIGRPVEESFVRPHDEGLPRIGLVEAPSVALVVDGVVAGADLLVADWSDLVRQFLKHTKEQDSSISVAADQSD